ncbi:type III secretion system export apparatus subunit SctV [Providencia sp. Me31A]|uniref:type III secretion system export apparatus subunit SctV n=1 Tax=Providencia sp. Me31A TaxID=3392637 RepID=UPI003D2946C2
MDRLNRWLQILSGRQDIILAIVLILTVFMIILPLPTLLIDILIAINFTVSLLLLMIAIYVNEPLEFSAFPAVLLITTLFRLSLSISTTRLILLQHDAGEIIYAFGDYVVGGNIIIGLIIFLIITIVQFIVITKGSERVAEVGARFSLDGMPGKQISIDGDMRAGTIDAVEAKWLRLLVQKESQLYGAMDGAMKFVKGDAIASMIIVAVNIFGGVAVGMLVHGMSASEAIQTYSILSIGDGLISQIPALLISITAGIIVTRVPGQKQQNLANEMIEQMAHQPQPLFLASGMLLLFSILPGFPSVVFLTLSLFIGGAGWFLAGKPFIKKKKGTKQESPFNAENSLLTEFKPGSIPLTLSISKNLRSYELEKALLVLRWNIFNQLGVIIPAIEFTENNLESVVEIYLYQEKIVHFNLEPDDLLFNVEQTGLTGNKITLYPGRVLYQYAKHDVKEESSAISGDARIIYCLEKVIRYYAKEFLGVQETKLLMDAMEQDYDELIKEVQRKLPLSDVASILQRLVQEDISIRDLRTIFETLIFWATKEKDSIILTEYVRTGLRRHIIGRYLKGAEALDIWIIGDVMEEMIRNSIRQTATGTYSILDIEDTQKIISVINDALNGIQEGLLITSIDIRLHLRKIIEMDLIDINVVSFQEIGSSVKFNVLGNIDLAEGSL